MLLVVNGVSQYNDSLASGFREATKKSDHNLVSLSYIDIATQHKFLENFDWMQMHEKCDNAEVSRKVSLQSSLTMLCF